MGAELGWMGSSPFHNSHRTITHTPVKNPTITHTFKKNATLT